MYDDLFPIEEKPQPLLDTDVSDILTRCYGNVGPDREEVIRQGRRLRYQRRKDAAERVLTRLLPVADGLERILRWGEQHSEGKEDLLFRNWLKTIEAVHRRLRGVMEGEGLVAVSGVGRRFDPDVQEIVEVKGDDPSGTPVVVDVAETGYVYDNRVIRDAKVVVERRLLEDSADAAADEPMSEED